MSRSFLIPLFQQRLIGSKMISIRCLMSKFASRQFASVSSSYSTRQKIATSLGENFTKVEIEVPWGKVSGKLWNSNDTQPILALHGWQDNAATFDKLVPLLPKTMSVLAVDFPGHGLSSWLPKGAIYDRLMYVQVIHRIRQHFGWEKIGLMGHSLGGMISFSYSALFPRDVKFVAALDFFKYPVVSVSANASDAAKELSYLFHLEKSPNPPSSFTEEQTIAKMMEGSEKSLDENACKILMARGVTKNNDGTVRVNRDPRVKTLNLMASFTDDHMVQKARLVRAPFLILKAADWHYNEKKTSYFECMQAIKENSMDFQFHELPGKHHFHLTNPEPIAKIMIPFLEKYH